MFGTLVASRYHLTKDGLLLFKFSQLVLEV
jgi:hypothetical protein